MRKLKKLTKKLRFQRIRQPRKGAPDQVYTMTHSGENSQKAGHNSLILLFRYEYSHSGVFGVTDYESDICFPKNKVANTKWRMISVDLNFFILKITTCRFLGSLIMNLILVSQIKK